jgi:hypothetical protein
MIDVLSLPKPQNGYIDYFFGDASTAATSWRTWEKPRGISMIHITCFGGGAGGGGGSSTNSLGGGGGGSGGQTTLLIPAHLLPDILYVSVGKGGAGATVMGSRGVDATASYVSIAPSTDVIYVACYANGGTSGSFGGGNGGVIAVQTSALMSNLGQFSALVGQSAATNITYPVTGLLVSAGAAGADTNATAGIVNAPTQSSFRFVPTVTPATGSTDGSNGISLFQPLLSTGGSGGAGVTGTGSSGGNGGFGSGGGGVGNPGGSTLTAGTAGGKGGDGLVIIQCF